MEKYDAIVIGAGMGGLAAAALWAKQGKKVLACESHYATGGCASFFKRREGYYDAGATTLSGLKEGRPTARLIKELGLELNLIKCDPGIIIHLGEERFSLFSDPERLGSEIKRVFQLDLQREIKQWMKLEEKLWEALSIARPLSMIKASDIFKLFLSNSRSLALHPSIFVKSFYDLLPYKAQKNESFIKCIDQILMISTQQGSRTCPAFMGILGFLYPMDTYAIDGGMHCLCDSLESKISELGGVIELRNPCLKVEKQGGEFIIQSKKEVYRASNLIVNIAPDLFNDIYSSDYKVSQRKGETWGALTAYFAFKSKSPVKDLYHQVHDYNRSLFYSFSVKNGPYQTVTVSTHINKDQFEKRGEEYQKIKESFKEEVLGLFKEQFAEYGIEEVKFDSVGTPLTFKHYTSRPMGEVGGLVHKNILSLTRLLPNQLSDPNIYYTGDYSFPGQGIVSVFQSAFNTLGRS